MRALHLTPKKKGRLALAVFSLWILACAISFWHFQFKDIRRFEDTLATFNANSLADIRLYPAGDRQAVAIHFIDPDCPCSRFSLPHIKQLELDLSEQIEFRPASTLADKSLNIPATPAVAIWSGTGELAYFGPYSGGAVCGLGNDFVAAVLKKLQGGNNPKWFNLDAVGCFCPRQHNSTKVAAL